MKTHTAQDTREFIHQSVAVRCYRVASAPATLKSSQLQIPNFFPTEPHGSSVALNWLQFTAELASANKGTCPVRGVCPVKVAGSAAHGVE